MLGKVTVPQRARLPEAFIRLRRAEGEEQAEDGAGGGVREERDRRALDEPRDILGQQPLARAPDRQKR